MPLKSLIIIIFFFVGTLAFHLEGWSQNENVFLHPKKFYKKYFPNLRIKPNPPDTLFIKSYPNYLSVSAHVLSPSIRVDIMPRKGNEGASRFRSNISDIIGFVATYKMASAGFALSLNSGIQTNSDYAKSRYRTATIKYGGGALMLEFKYLRFRGLTDVNYNNADPMKQYVKRPDLVGKEFHFEGLYNFAWKKYSYIAPFTFAQQQIKSRVGFMLKPGVYYSRLIGESPLIATSQQGFYDDFSDVTEIRTLSIKLAPGVGGNFIFFKHFYFSAVLFPSYDLYLYKYLNLPDEKVKGKQTFVFVLDGRVSMGYQSKRIYAGLYYDVERRNTLFYNISTNYIYSFLGLGLGYRFNTPRIVKKIYKETMPPGT